jgi:hypothetical protein
MSTMMETANTAAAKRPPSGIVRERDRLLPIAFAGR